jgi:hypothetical protein
MRDGDDTHAYWMGYMLQTVKDMARRTHDKSCVDALRVFVETSRLAQPNDLEALDKALSDDDPLYRGYSRQVPDTPALRLAGVFACNPDERGDAA